MGFGPIRRLSVGGDGAGEKEVKCFPPFLTVGAYRAYHRPQVEAPGQEGSRAAKGCGGRWWGHLAGGGETGKAWALCGCSLCSDLCLLFWSSVSESKRRDSAFLSCSILSILPWPLASYPWQLLPRPLVAPEPCPTIAASCHARLTPGSSSSGESRSWWGYAWLGGLGRISWCIEAQGRADTCREENLWGQISIEVLPTLSRLPSSYGTWVTTIMVERQS